MALARGTIKKPTPAKAVTVKRKPLFWERVHPSKLHCQAESRTYPRWQHRRSREKSGGGPRVDQWSLQIIRRVTCGIRGGGQPIDVPIRTLSRSQQANGTDSRMKGQPVRTRAQGENPLMCRRHPHKTPTWRSAQVPVVVRVGSIYVHVYTEKHNK